VAVTVLCRVKPSLLISTISVASAIVVIEGRIFLWWAIITMCIAQQLAGLVVILLFPVSNVFLAPSER
jgi:hypothetical protein